MRGAVSRDRQVNAGVTGSHVRRTLTFILCIAGLGLALGACTKCDVPNWFPKPPGQAPQTCHGTPAPQ